jgi:hypothetical protein
MLDTLCDQNVFYQRCVLFNDSALGKITGRSRFTWFLFGHFRNTVAWIFTPFFKLTYNFCFNVIWHRQYVVIFNLTWFGIHDLWPLLSCVGGDQTVPSLSRHQSHVWIHYNGDIIKQLSWFTLQQQQLMLLKWMRNVNFRHLLQSKWKIGEGQSVLMGN